MSIEHAMAYFNEGKLRRALEAYSACAAADPQNPDLHYEVGLCHKYLFEWKDCLRANLKALELSEELDPAALWNAGIAATALGEWAIARNLWEQEGITLPEGTGPAEADFGLCVLYLNRWGSGETVYAQRLDPVRARILSVPLLSSGYQWGDVVLHDGASLGTREVGGSELFIFAGLEVLQESEHRTFTAEVHAPEESDAQALSALSMESGDGVGLAEDWTYSVRYLCQECARGGDGFHEHDHDEAPEGWQLQRFFGIPARNRKDAEDLLARWASGGSGREVVELQLEPLGERSRPSDEIGKWWV